VIPFRVNSAMIRMMGIAIRIIVSVIMIVDLVILI
jgi:hypothetical protein